MRLRLSIVKSILVLGLSSFLTQCAALVMQIIMNQQTIKYGALSQYGADIPLTVFGIVNKVNGLMMSLIMGISVGSQPLFSYNYGAKLFTRVKKTGADLPDRLCYHRLSRYAVSADLPAADYFHIWSGKRSV